MERKPVFIIVVVDGWVGLVASDRVVGFEVTHPQCTCFSRLAYFLVVVASKER